MENLETGNSSGSQEVAGGAQPAQTTASIESVMAGMLNDAPDAKPAAGDKAEGTKEGTQQKTLPAWTAQLPDDVRSNADVMKQLEKFEKIGDLATSYAQLESKIGNSIVKPGKDATEGEISAFYEKLGRPKKLEDYSISDKDADVFKSIAFRNNLTDEQFKGIYEGIKGISEKVNQQQDEARQQQLRSTEEALRKEYGTSYGEKVQLMQRGIEAYGGKELGALLNNAGVLFSQPIVKLFIQLGEQQAEAGVHTAGTGGGNAQYVPLSQGGTMNFKGL